MLDTTKDYVFLSYSHNDDINPLLEHFSAKGYNVVYDTELHAGDLWDIKVRGIIKDPKCKGVLTVLSSISLTSTAILKETDYIKLFDKKCACITLENRSLLESFSSLPEGEGKEIAERIIEYYPPQKIFIKSSDILNDVPNPLDNTLKEWGIFIDESQKGYVPVDHYTSNLAGEIERLHNQQKGYYKFDMSAIQSVLNNDPKKGNYVVLDLGCSNGEITSSRFADERFSTVIGIDYNEKDILKAKSANYGDKFHFYTMNLESDSFIYDLKDELTKLGVDKIDIVFMALTLHHLVSPTKLLFNLFDIFSDDGQIIIRGSDDGGKLCHPENELMQEFFTRYNNLFQDVSDRFNGRKLYKQLLDTGYVNISMQYNVTDTCEKSRNEKVQFYHIGFAFREARLHELAEKNPNNTKLLDEINWLLNTLSHIKELFGKRDFWYSNVSYIAIASVR